MKKLTKAILIILIIVPIVAFLLVNNLANNIDYKCKEIVDADTNISYLCIDNDSYPQIYLESVELGLFTQNTFERMDDIYLCDNNYITGKEDDIFKIDKEIFQTQNYGYKKLNENTYLYFQIDSNRILTYFACAGFELPELNVENIDQIRVEFIDDTINKPNIIKDRSTIEKIVNEYTDYFADNQITDIYVTYKDLALEEWFDIYKLTQIKDKQS